MTAAAQDLDPAVAAMVETLTNEKRVKRLVITGVPKAGKTTIANVLGEFNGKSPTVRHTDELIETHKWGDDSVEVAKWFDEPGIWIIEGVSAVRALRKWMRGDEKRGLEHHEGKPCDAVLWLGDPIEALEGRVASLAKGCHTVWRDIEQELIDRGVVIIEIG